jgi:2-iminobutanoate/2-iminopropanoate deaminase
VVANGMAYIAGQVPMHPESRAVPPGFGDQVRRVLDNLAAIAVATGTSFDQAVRVGVYLADIDRFQEGTVYRDYFSDPPPARTTVGVSLQGFDVEMDAIVALDGQA